MVVGVWVVWRFHRVLPWFSLGEEEEEYFRCGVKGREE